MLWIWANYKNYTRYFFLNLVDGLLQLEVSCVKVISLTSVRKICVLFQLSAIR